MNEKVTLARGDTVYLYLAFRGLPDGASARVQVGESAWADVDFVGDPDHRPRVLLRGPEAPNSAALLVPDSGPIRVQFASAPEQRSIGGGYLTLVTPRD